MLYARGRTCWGTMDATIDIGFFMEKVIEPYLETLLEWTLDCNYL